MRKFLMVAALVPFGLGGCSLASGPAIPTPAWAPLVTLADVGLSGGQNMTRGYASVCKSLGGTYTPTGGGVCK